MPMKPKPDPEKYCKTCGARMARKKIEGPRCKGQVEGMKGFLRRKYCDRKCMGKAFVRENPTRSGYLCRIRHLRKSYCEICKTTTERLTLHHKDRDWTNNDPANIQTLCSSCHTSLHHAAGEIVPLFTPKTCKYCLRPNVKRNICDTCRTRIKRHGNPYHGWNEYLALRRQSSRQQACPTEPNASPD